MAKPGIPPACEDCKLDRKQKPSDASTSGNQQQQTPDGPTSENQGQQKMPAAHGHGQEDSDAAGPNDQEQGVPDVSESLNQEQQISDTSDNPQQQISDVHTSDSRKDETLDVSAPGSQEKQGSDVPPSSENREQHTGADASKTEGPSPETQAQPQKDVSGNNETEDKTGILMATLEDLVASAIADPFSLDDAQPVNAVNDHASSDSVNPFGPIANPFGPTGLATDSGGGQSGAAWIWNALSANPPPAEQFDWQKLAEKTPPKEPASASDTDSSGDTLDSPAMERYIQQVAENQQPSWVCQTARMVLDRHEFHRRQQDSRPTVPRPPSPPEQQNVIRNMEAFAERATRYLEGEGDLLDEDGSQDDEQPGQQQRGQPEHRQHRPREQKQQKECPNQPERPPKHQPQPEQQNLGETEQQHQADHQAEQQHQQDPDQQEPAQAEQQQHHQFEQQGEGQWVQRVAVGRSHYSTDADRLLAEELSSRYARGKDWSFFMFGQLPPIQTLGGFAAIRGIQKASAQVTGTSEEDRELQMAIEISMAQEYARQSQKDRENNDHFENNNNDRPPKQENEEPCRQQNIPPIKIDDLCQFEGEAAALSPRKLQELQDFQLAKQLQDDYNNGPLTEDQLAALENTQPPPFMPPKAAHHAQEPVGTRTDRQFAGAASSSEPDDDCQSARARAHLQKALGARMLIDDADFLLMGLFTSRFLTPLSTGGFCGSCFQHDPHKPPALKGPSDGTPQYFNTPWARRQLARQQEERAAESTYVRPQGPVTPPPDSPPPSYEEITAIPGVMVYPPEFQVVLGDTDDAGEELYSFMEMGETHFSSEWVEDEEEAEGGYERDAADDASEEKAKNEQQAEDTRAPESLLAPTQPLSSQPPAPPSCNSPPSPAKSASPSSTQTAQSPTKQQRAAHKEKLRKPSDVAAETAEEDSSAEQQRIALCMGTGAVGRSCTAVSPENARARRLPFDPNSPTAPPKETSPESEGLPPQSQPPSESGSGTTSGESNSGGNEGDGLPENKANTPGSFVPPPCAPVQRPPSQNKDRRETYSDASDTNVHVSIAGIGAQGVSANSGQPGQFSRSTLDRNRPIHSLGATVQIGQGGSCASSLQPYAKFGSGARPKEPRQEKTTRKTKRKSADKNPVPTVTVNSVPGHDGDSVAAEPVQPDTGKTERKVLQAVRPSQSGKGSGEDEHDGHQQPANNTSNNNNMAETAGGQSFFNNVPSNRLLEARLARNPARYVRWYGHPPPGYPSIPDPRGNATSPHRQSTPPFALRKPISSPVKHHNPSPDLRQPTASPTQQPVSYCPQENTADIYTRQQLEVRRGLMMALQIIQTPDEPNQPGAIPTEKSSITSRDDLTPPLSAELLYEAAKPFSDSAHKNKDDIKDEEKSAQEARPSAQQDQHSPQANADLALPSNKNETPDPDDSRGLDDMVFDNVVDNDNETFDNADGADDEGLDNKAFDDNEEGQDDEATEADEYEEAKRVAELQRKVESLSIDSAHLKRELEYYRQILAASATKESKDRWLAQQLRQKEQEEKEKQQQELEKQLQQRQQEQGSRRQNPTWRDAMRRQPRYVCLICPRRPKFDCALDLENHMKFFHEHLNSPKPPFRCPCNVCEKGHNWQGDESPFSFCPQCAEDA